MGEQNECVLMAHQSLMHVSVETGKTIRRRIEKKVSRHFFFHKTIAF